MKISILCSDSSHPVNGYLEKWSLEAKDSHVISILREKSELIGGDILFLISCSEIIDEAERKKFRYCLVIHASDLPKGKGWSPYIWDILNGNEKITISLIEAEDKLDTGRIWEKISVPIPKHYLWDEINDVLFKAEIDLIEYAIINLDQVNPKPQPLSKKSSYYRKRTPSDSKVDPNLSISQQFDLIRVCDPIRYPAYFEHLDHKYKLTIEKIK